MKIHEINIYFSKKYFSLEFFYHDHLVHALKHQFFSFFSVNRSINEDFLILEEHRSNTAPQKYLKLTARYITHASHYS
jgi:hypothetical protein